MLVAAAAMPAAAVSIGLPVHYEGEPVGVTYDNHGTPAMPGDDQVGLSKTLSHTDIDLSDVTKYVPVPELPPGYDEMDFRDLGLEHPVFRALDLVDETVVDPLGLPADVDLNEEGIGVGVDLPTTPAAVPLLPFPIPPLWDAPTSGTIPWPGDGYGLVPLGFDMDRIGFTDHSAGSTQELLDAFDRQTAQRCGLPVCPPGVADAADQLLPDVVWHWQMASWTASLQVHVELAADSASDAGAGGLAALDADGGPARLPDVPLAGTALAPIDAPHALPLPDGGARGAGNQDLAPQRAVASQDAALSPAGSPAAAAMAGFAVAALGMPLYRRIVRSRVLHHQVREQFLALVRSEPGIHESAVAQRLGISHTLAQYHARVLTDFGMLEMKRFGGRKCLFAAGQVGRAEKALRAAEHGPASQLVDLVAAQPGMQQRDLARALGVRESTVKWHLDRLEADGVVVVERDPVLGKRTRLAPGAEQARLETASRALPAAAPEPVAAALAGHLAPAGAAPGAFPGEAMA